MSTERAAIPEVATGLRKLRLQPGDMVAIRYLEAGRTVAGRLLDVDLKRDPVVIEVEYAQLLSIAQVGIGEPLPAVEAQFRLVSAFDDELTLDLLGARLHQFFEFVEGVRSLSNAASAQVSEPVYAEPPVVKTLSVASPVELVLEIANEVRQLIPYGLVGVLLAAASRLVTKRKEWHEGTGQRHQNRLLELDIEERELEVSQRRAELELRNQLIQRLYEAHPNSRLPRETADRLINEYVLPPLRALGQRGITSVEDNEENGEPSQ